MEGVYLERKCFYIGHWKDDTVADTIIRQVAGKVRNGGGTKCKLHLSREGIKVTTSSLMYGKHLKEVAQFDDIYFTTVNQYNPQCLLVITKDERRRYRILAFRCKNETDVAFFVSCFKDLKTVKNGISNTIELRQVSDGNWTLRARHPAKDKRQLSRIVDMNANTNVHLKQNGVIIPKHTDINSNVDMAVTSAYSVPNHTKNFNSNNGYVERNDPMAMQTVIAEVKDDEVSNLYSTTDSGLRNELDHLSHELREIKFMLETSAGLSTDVHHDKRKKEVDFVEDDTRIEVEIVDAIPPTPLTAVVLDDNENDSSDGEEVINTKNANLEDLNESKNTKSTTSSDSEIKVAVPDYRSSETQHIPKYERRYIPKENNTTFTNGNLNSPRISTTSYDTWKEDVVMRRNVSPREETQPRTAYLNSSLQGTLRDRNSHVIYATSSRKHHTLPHQSLRVPFRKSSNHSSTIERPIEKVYPRPKSAHGSIVYRPSSGGQRGTVYNVSSTKKTYMDKNQNKVYVNGQRLNSSTTHKKDDNFILKT